MLDWSTLTDMCLTLVGVFTVEEVLLEKREGPVRPLDEAVLGLLGGLQVNWELFSGSMETSTTVR